MTAKRKIVPKMLEWLPPELQVEDKCGVCDGHGWDQDEHPHNGSPCGPKETCATCKGGGTIMREMTEAERIARIEKHLGIVK